MSTMSKPDAARISLIIAIISLFLSGISLYEQHFSGPKIRIEAFESHRETVKFILYNSGRETAFVDRVSIQELDNDGRKSRVGIRFADQLNKNPFPSVSPSEDITIEPKSSVKLSGKVPFPGATITKTYRLIVSDAGFKTLADKTFQVAW